MRDFISSCPDAFFISGMGYCLGDQKVTNEDLLERFSIRLKLSFIDKSIGIKSRYFAAPHQASSDLAVKAAQAALAQAEISIHQVDRLIVATSTPDHQTPSTACIVQHKLGGSGFPAHDIVSACSGFLYALDHGLRCLATGDETILVVGVDCRSRTLNSKDKRTAFLYGDGSGAVVLSKKSHLDKSSNFPLSENRLGFQDCLLVADGEGHDAVYVPAGGSKEPCTPEALSENRHRLTMPSGERVAQNALKGFTELIQRILDRNQLSLNEIDQIIFHQPNRRLLEGVLRVMRIDETKAFINFEHYGNTVAASVPIALAQACEAGRIKTGDKVILCAVGGGYSGGVALINWC